VAGGGCVIAWSPRFPFRRVRVILLGCSFGRSRGMFSRVHEDSPEFRSTGSSARDCAT
jgi:hypothetical protein